jgi:hypothetical protein
MTGRILDILNTVIVALAEGVILLSVLLQLLTWPARGAEPNVAETLKAFIARCVTYTDIGQAKTLDQTLNAGYCAGYISGIIDAHTILVGSRRAESQWCLPKQGISAMDAALVVVKWADDHPERLHETARVEIMIALHMAFPCPQ